MSIKKNINYSEENEKDNELVSDTSDIIDNATDIIVNDTDTIGNATEIISSDIDLISGATDSITTTNNNIQYFVKEDLGTGGVASTMRIIRNTEDDLDKYIDGVSDYIKKKYGIHTAGRVAKIFHGKNFSDSFIIKETNTKKKLPIANPPTLTVKEIKFEDPNIIHLDFNNIDQVYHTDVLEQVVWDNIKNEVYLGLNTLKELILLKDEENKFNEIIKDHINYVLPTVAFGLIDLIRNKIDCIKYETKQEGRVLEDVVYMLDTIKEFLPQEWINILEIFFSLKDLVRVEYLKKLVYLRDKIETLAHKDKRFCDQKIIESLNNNDDFNYNFILPEDVLYQNNYIDYIKTTIYSEGIQRIEANLFNFFESIINLYQRLELIILDFSKNEEYLYQLSIIENCLLEERINRSIDIFDEIHNSQILNNEFNNHISKYEDSIDKMKLILSYDYKSVLSKDDFISFAKKVLQDLDNILSNSHYYHTFEKPSKIILEDIYKNGFISNDFDSKIKHYLKLRDIGSIDKAIDQEKINLSKYLPFIPNITFQEIQQYLDKGYNLFEQKFGLKKVIEHIDNSIGVYKFAGKNIYKIIKDFDRVSFIETFVLNMNKVVKDFRYTLLKDLLSGFLTKEEVDKYAESIIKYIKIYWLRIKKDNSYVYDNTKSRKLFVDFIRKLNDLEGIDLSAKLNEIDIRDIVSFWEGINDYYLIFPKSKYKKKQVKLLLDCYLLDKEADENNTKDSDLYKIVIKNLSKIIDSFDKFVDKLREREIEIRSISGEELSIEFLEYLKNPKIKKTIKKVLQKVPNKNINSFWEFLYRHLSSKGDIYSIDFYIMYCTLFEKYVLSRYEYIKLADNKNYISEYKEYIDSYYNLIIDRYFFDQIETLNAKDIIEQNTYNLLVFVLKRIFGEELIEINEEESVNQYLRTILRKDQIGKEDFMLDSTVIVRYLINYIKSQVKYDKDRLYYFKESILNVLKYINCDKIGFTLEEVQAFWEELRSRYYLDYSHGKDRNDEDREKVHALPFYFEYGKSEEVNIGKNIKTTIFKNILECPDSWMKKILQNEDLPELASLLSLMKDKENRDNRAYIGSLGKVLELTREQIQGYGNAAISFNVGLTDFGKIENTGMRAFIKMDYIIFLLSYSEIIIEKLNRYNLYSIKLLREILPDKELFTNLLNRIRVLISGTKNENVFNDLKKYIFILYELVLGFKNNKKFSELTDELEKVGSSIDFKFPSLEEVIKKIKDNGAEVYSNLYHLDELNIETLKPDNNMVLLPTALEAGGSYFLALAEELPKTITVSPIYGELLLLFNSPEIGYRGNEYIGPTSLIKNYFGYSVLVGFLALSAGYSFNYNELLCYSKPVFLAINAKKHIIEEYLAKNYININTDKYQYDERNHLKYYNLTNIFSDDFIENKIFSYSKDIFILNKENYLNEFRNLFGDIVDKKKKDIEQICNKYLSIFNEEEDIRWQYYEFLKEILSCVYEVHAASIKKISAKIDFITYLLVGILDTKGLLESGINELTIRKLVNKLGISFLSCGGVINNLERLFSKVLDLVKDSNLEDKISYLFNDIKNSVCILYECIDSMELSPYSEKNILKIKENINGIYLRIIDLIKKAGLIEKIDKNDINAIKNYILMLGVNTYDNHFYIYNQNCINDFLEELFLEEKALMNLEQDLLEQKLKDIGFGNEEIFELKERNRLMAKASQLEEVSYRENINNINDLYASILSLRSVSFIHSINKRINKYDYNLSRLRTNLIHVNIIKENILDNNILDKFDFGLDNKKLNIKISNVIKLYYSFYISNSFNKYEELKNYLSTFIEENILKNVFTDCIKDNQLSDKIEKNVFENIYIKLVEYFNFTEQEIKIIDDRSSKVFLDINNFYYKHNIEAYIISNLYRAKLVDVNNVFEVSKLKKIKNLDIEEKIELYEKIIKLEEDLLSKYSFNVGYSSYKNEKEFLAGIFSFINKEIKKIEDRNNVYIKEIVQGKRNPATLFELVNNAFKFDNIDERENVLGKIEKLDEFETEVVKDIIVNCLIGYNNNSSYIKDIMYYVSQITDEKEKSKKIINLMLNDNNIEDMGFNDYVHYRLESQKNSSNLEKWCNILISTRGLEKTQIYTIIKNDHTEYIDNIKKNLLDNFEETICDLLIDVNLSENVKAALYKEIQSTEKEFDKYIEHFNTINHNDILEDDFEDLEECIINLSRSKEGVSNFIYNSLSVHTKNFITLHLRDKGKNVYLANLKKYFLKDINKILKNHNLYNIFSFDLKRIPDSIKNQIVLKPKDIELLSLNRNILNLFTESSSIGKRIFVQGIQKISNFVRDEIFLDNNIKSMILDTLQHFPKDDVLVNVNVVKRMLSFILKKKISYILFTNLNKFIEVNLLETNSLEAFINTAGLSSSFIYIGILEKFSENQKKDILKFIKDILFLSDKVIEEEISEFENRDIMVAGTVKEDDELEANIDNSNYFKDTILYDSMAFRINNELLNEMDASKYLNYYVMVKDFRSFLSGDLDLIDNIERILNKIIDQNGVLNNDFIEFMYRDACNKGSLNNQISYLFLDAPNTKEQLMNIAFLYFNEKNQLGYPSTYNEIVVEIVEEVPKKYFDEEVKEQVQNIIDILRECVTIRDILNNIKPYADKDFPGINRYEGLKEVYDMLSVSQCLDFRLTEDLKEIIISKCIVICINWWIDKLKNEIKRQDSLYSALNKLFNLKINEHQDLLKAKLRNYISPVMFPPILKKMQNSSLMESYYFINSIVHVKEKLIKDLLEILGKEINIRVNEKDNQIVHLLKIFYIYENVKKPNINFNELVMEISLIINSCINIEDLETKLLTVIDDMSTYSIYEFLMGDVIDSIDELLRNKLIARIKEIIEKRLSLIERYIDIGYIYFIKKLKKDDLSLDSLSEIILFLVELEEQNMDRKKIIEKIYSYKLIDEMTIQNNKS